MILIFILWTATSFANVAIESNLSVTCDPAVPTQAVSLPSEYLNTEDVRCSELAQGELRLVPSDGYYTGERLIKRVGANRYQVMVNLNYVTTTGSVSPEQMLARVQSCLARAAPALRGPGGAMMEIIPLTANLLRDIPAALRPRPAPAISIAEDGPQAFSTQYPSNVSCSTIIHETLHVLGLADEYDPRNRPEYPQISCRNIPSVPYSVMNFHEEATTRAIPRTNNCDCSANPCQAIIRGTNQNQRSMFLSASFEILASRDFKANCQVRNLPTTSNLLRPDKAITSFSEIGDSISFENRVFEQSTAAPFQIKRTSVTCTCSSDNYECAHNKRLLREASIQNRGLPNCPWSTGSTEGEPRSGAHGTLAGNVLILQSTPIDDSLLHPNQFERVLKGDCPGGSRNYKSCGTLAYVPDTDVACTPEMRQQCQSPQFYLGARD